MPTMIYVLLEVILFWSYINNIIRRDIATNFLYFVTGNHMLRAHRFIFFFLQYHNKYHSYEFSEIPE